MAQCLTETLDCCAATRCSLEVSFPTSCSAARRKNVAADPETAPHGCSVVFCISLRCACCSALGTFDAALSVISVQHKKSHMYCLEPISINFIYITPTLQKPIRSSITKSNHSTHFCRSRLQWLNHWNTLPDPHVSAYRGLYGPWYQASPSWTCNVSRS